MNHNRFGNGPGKIGNGGSSRQGHQGGRPFQAAPQLQKITAPYNFVPLSEKVFLPEWADQVSHDVPFADGICGELVCELITHTPVYVRNGGQWEHDEVMQKEEAQSFFYVKQGDSRLFMIPGTTSKGMLRNVIEIASFGKMNRVDDHRYSVRDLTNPNKKLYVDHMTETVTPGTYRSKAKAGWLTMDPESEEWLLAPCQMARVEQNDLINVHPKKPETIKRRQGAFGKYRIWGAGLDVAFDHSGERDHPHSCGMLRYIKADNLGKGSLKGTVVFTGQPAENRRHIDARNRSKHMEFIFFEFDAPPRQIVVPPQIRKEFLFNHSDANGVPNEEWGEWKKTLGNGRVPVFYLEKQGELSSIGLALMYRLPYCNSIADAIRHTTPDHFDQAPDLAETIFGYVDGSRDSLKGRVSISPAVAVSAKPQDKVIQTVLSAPKPSFYPNYIEQPNPNVQYKTFMDDDCKIRGWKRYPVKVNNISPSSGVTDKVDTRMIPLEPGARFTFRVKVHNLKPVELGALVWALTWGGDHKLRHSLGMGKSYGFGQVSISITGASLADMADHPVEWSQAMEAFVSRMDQEVGGRWQQTAQLEQLLAMANPQMAPQCGALKHLDLAMGGNNEFVLAKKSRLALLPHVKSTGFQPKADAKAAERVSLAPQPAQAAPQPRSVEIQTWEVARLGYNPGPKILIAQGPDGQRGEVKLEGTSCNLVQEEILHRLRKGKPVNAQVTAEKQGSNWCITGVQVLT